MTVPRRRWLAITTRVSVALALLAVAAAVTWLLWLYQPAVARRGPAAGRPEVPVFRARQVQVARQWRGYGTAEAMDQSNVPARITATVQRVPRRIEAGRAVEQGELLVKLDPSDFEQQVSAAEQQLRELRATLNQLDIEQRRLKQQLELERQDVAVARSEFERFKQLRERGAANDQDVDTAKRQLINAQRSEVATAEALEQIPTRRQQLKASIAAQRANLEQARLNLQRTRITSPLAGILESVNVEPGEGVAAGQQVARVVSLQHLEVPLRLPASARGEVAADDPVTLQATNDSGLSWSGQVTRIAPTDDPEARTVTVYVELRQSIAAPQMNERAELLAPGMFVEGMVTSRRKQSRWVVPRRAIRGGMIRVIEQGQVVSRPVQVAWTFEGRVPKLGLAADRQWAVLAGELSSGQMVMAGASSSVLDGQRVDPVLITGAHAAGDDTSEASP